MPASLNARASRGRARALLPFLAMPLAAMACTYFPSHEEVYIPIPLDIGEQRIENGDTTYVLAERGYRIIAPRRQVLADARHDLESAVRQFERYFRVTPDSVTIRYVDSLDARALRDLEIARLSGVPRDDREIVLPSRRAPSFRGDRNPPPPSAAPAAARAWIVAHARRTADEARGAPSATDTIRIPAWIASAMSDLIAYGTAVGSPRQLWEQRGDLLPVAELFALERLEGDPVPSERLGQRDVERIAIRRLQSASVARYLVEREGEDFLGQVAERLFRGQTIRDALQGAEVIPRDLAELDQAWRDWLGQVASGR